MTPDLVLAADGDVVVARLTGEVDLGDTAEVSSRVLGAVPNEASGLVVDLAAVRYLDSAAIQMLFEFTRLLEAGRQGMAVVVPETSPLRSLLAMTGLHHAAALCLTAAEAIEAVRGGVGRRY